ncbi:S8 family serine peptidase [Pontibacter sp. CAU 1760]
MRSTWLLLTLSWFLLAHVAFGQASGEAQKRLVYFNDKQGTPFSLNRPEAFLSPKALSRRQRQQIPITPRDLPVSPAYVSALKDLGVAVWYSSRWFNAAVVQCSDEQLQQIKGLPFVKQTRTLNRVAIPPENKILRTKLTVEEQVSEAVAQQALDQATYGLSFHQANMLGATNLHEAGYTGKGLTIAVFDAGFPQVNTLEPFAHLFQNSRILGTYDFVDKQEQVYSSNAHGTLVLSTMAAFAPGKIIGTAYEANYLLLRTEDVASEHHIEEINWLLAAEYADSAGADVINSSLGYTTFDNPSVSYTYADLNGNTTLVAKAADIAAATGMLVVVSAGNEGNKTWKYMGSPADADSVLAVGAIDSVGVKASFSSFGPTSDGQIKPDVVALGANAYVLSTTGQVVRANGTSFSGPIMAGFVTSLWQANYSKTNLQMIQLLRQSSNQAAAPDNSVGYGVPSYSRTLTALPHLPLKSYAYLTNPVQAQPLVLTLGEEWWTQPMQISITNVAGKQVYTQLLNNPKKEQQLQLEPRQLQAGLYLCQLRSGKKVVTLKFVKT